MALGIYYKPRCPTNTTPASAAAVFPVASLTSSAYLYDAAYTHTAAPFSDTPQDVADATANPQRFYRLVTPALL